MLTFLKKLRRDERGVSALEYAILAGIVVVAVIAGTSTLSEDLTSLFTNISTSVGTAADNSDTGTGTGG